MPVCSSTRACIQTGRYPLRTGIGEAINTASDSFVLANGEVLLSELLRDGFPPPQAPSNLPYRRGAFGKWHLSGTLPGTPPDPNHGHAIANGYHRFFGSMGNVGDHFEWTKIQHDPAVLGPAPVLVEIDGRTSDPPDFTTATWQTSVTRADASDWIQDQVAQGSPFFAYVCFNSAHSAWTVPPLSLLSQETRDELDCAQLAPGFGGPDCPEELLLIYRAMVEAMDTEIGALIDGIPGYARDNTMIFVVGDNGTPGQVIDDDAHDAFHGKGTVMQWGINVPLIVSGPVIPTPPSSEGWMSDALVSVVDFWRTIRDVTGASESSAAPLPLDSVSFLSVLRDPSAPGARTSVYTSLFKPLGVWSPSSCFTVNRRATTNGEYKYVRRPIGGGCLPAFAYEEAFYHLASDPEEGSNLLDGSGGLIHWSPSASSNLSLLRNAMNAIEP
jgi:arylsulfatase A-like enzyme